MNESTTPNPLQIVITVGTWVQDTRFWSGPPLGDDKPNPAAHVRVNRYWPFKHYNWAVYSPFHNEAVFTGRATSLEAAKEAADEALEELCTQARFA